MACKDKAFAGFREEASRNRSFPTRYYSDSVHRGALALPPFMQEAFAAIK